MEKVLPDIDISRSAPVACFLELEAAARSCMDLLDDQIIAQNKIETIRLCLD